LELELHGALNLKLQKIEFKLFKKFQKKYHGVDNVVFYQCVIFQIKICYILGSAKKTNKDFILGEYIENLILSFCAILLFLLSPKYNIFLSKILQKNNSVKHCLHHDIFFDFF
jgi:hypothetical protein